MLIRVQKYEIETLELRKFYLFLLDIYHEKMNLPGIFKVLNGNKILL